MKRNYWENRAALLQYDRMESAEEVAREIAEIYRHAYNTIAYKMRAIFRAFRYEFQLDDHTARRLLNTMTDGSIAELKKALNKIGTPGALALRAKLAAPEYAKRLARFQKLLAEVEEIGREIYGADLRRQNNWYTSLCEDTYNMTIYDIQRQTGLAFSFNHIDADLIEDVMGSTFSGYKTYSKTLWRNVEGVTREVRKQLTLGLITGKTEAEMSKELANKYSVGAFESRRLIRTESCYLSNEIQFKAYQECGADKYQYVATLDTKTDEECGVLDRKIFRVKDKRIGVNAPPLHPFCRCTTKIYIDQNTRDDLQRRARDPQTGKNYTVPASMSYSTWARINDVERRGAPRG